MKKLAAIILLLLFPVLVSARTGLLRYGIEWGFSANFLEGHNFVYQTETEPHYLVPADKGTALRFSGNGFVLLNFGLNIGEKSSLALVAGYEGVYKSRACFPILLRYYHYPSKVHSDGHYFFVDAGPGLPDGGGKVMAQADAGAGYRVALSEKVNLDIILSIRGIYDRPPIWDAVDETYISPQYIRKNDAFYASFNLGIAINF